MFKISLCHIIESVLPQTLLVLLHLITSVFFSCYKLFWVSSGILGKVDGLLLVGGTGQVTVVFLTNQTATVWENMLFSFDFWGSCAQSNSSFLFFISKSFCKKVMHQLLYVIIVYCLMIVIIELAHTWNLTQNCWGSIWGSNLSDESIQNELFF